MTKDEYDALFSVIIALVSAAMIFSIGYWLASDQRNALEEGAFERGYMQQCAGTSKLYWRGECPETE